MAVGDEAAAAGYPILDGAADKIIDGDTEINRTRDFVAQVKVSVPVSKAAFRTASGISSGTGDPTGGSDGDIYFKILS
jgi:hypothetical protein